IVVAGVIVVASIVAMIIVAVVIQHQKYSGLGRRGLPSDSDVNSLNYKRRIDAFEGGFKRIYKDGDEIPKQEIIVKENCHNKKKKVIIYEYVNKDQSEDENKENLLVDGEKEDETDALINKMMAAENKDDKKEGLEQREQNKQEDEYEEELEEKVNFDEEYANDIWRDFDEDGQDELDQQTVKEGAETEEEENQLLIKIRIQKKKQSCS
ncbi:MAG: hypothetical protein EZS28_038258, partial [Streblomastix strix]